MVTGGIGGTYSLHKVGFSSTYPAWQARQDVSVQFVQYKFISVQDEHASLETASKYPVMQEVHVLASEAHAKQFEMWYEHRLTTEPTIA